MNDMVDTVTKIMDVAQNMMQVGGYHSFSYADIAEQIGIRRASIHYYFPNKVDLVKAVLARYRNTVKAGIVHLEQQELSAPEKLKMAVEFFASLIQDGNRVCLCGVLSGELPKLPTEIHAEVQGYFTDLAEGFTRIIKEGLAAGVFQIRGTVEEEAQALVAGMEGAMLVARAFNSSQRAVDVGLQMIRHLSV